MFKLETLWDEEKIRILHKKQLIIALIGAPILPFLYTLFAPSNYAYKTFLIIVPLVIMYPISIYNYLNLKKPNQAIRFLILYMFIQVTVILFMAVTGGFRSAGQFVPFVVVFLTSIFLGSRAALIIAIEAALTITGLFLWLLVYGPYPGLYSDFFFYLGTFLLVVFVQRDIGKDLSLQFEAKKKLEEIDDLKNQFIALTSHYLRSPLTVIKAALAQLDRPDSVANIRSSVANLEGLVEKLLTISSIERGEVVINPFMSDLNNITQAAVSDFQGVVFKPSNPPIPKFSFDPTRIKQSISILIDNAIKYGKKDDQSQVSLSQDKAEVVISVSDHGVGITEDKLETVFEAFNKGGMDKTLQMDNVGPGLSLYIAKIIVEAHAGTISAKSVLGQGSTFTIRLPIRLQVTVNS